MLSKMHQRGLAKEADNFSDRKQRIYDFLAANQIGVLSTVDPNSEPHGVVIYYRVDPDFQIYFLTRSHTKKYDNLIHNDHVMLTVFEPKTQTTVQIAGTAKEVKDSDTINDIAGTVLGTSLRTSDGGLLPITKLEAGEYTAFRVVPLQIRMAVYARPDSGGYEELLESIESFDLYD